jgi:Retrotransposon gag protein
VVLYNGVWHALGHSTSADRPTLGEPLVDIHKYDEPEEPIEPPPVYTPVAPGTLDPIEEEQQTQLLIRLDTPIEEEPKQGQGSTSSGSSETDTDTTDELDQEIRNSPIVTQQLLSMATQTQTQTTQTTTGSTTGGSGAVIGTAITMTMQQAIQQSLAHALRRGGPPVGGSGGPSRSGGSGGLGGPGGPGAPGRGGSLGPGGPPSGPLAPVPAPAPAPAAAPAAGQPGDERPVGDLPTIFTGKREDTEQFINEMEGYFLLNQNIPKYCLPIQKVALALTLIKGAEVAGWARDIRTWVAGLNPATQNVPEVWEQFMAEFLDQFADTQATICTQTKLDELRMVYPHIDKYIADFEKTARQVGYTQGNEETKHHFIQGMANKILEDVL